MRLVVRPRRSDLLGLVGPGLLVACAASCSGSGEVTRADTAGESLPKALAQPDAESSDGPGGPSAPSPASAPAPGCDSPEEGCPCDVAGQTSVCRGPPVANGSYVYCLVGHRVCDGRSWGSCVLPSVHGADGGG